LISISPDAFIGISVTRFLRHFLVLNIYGYRSILHITLPNTSAIQSDDKEEPDTAQKLLLYMHIKMCTDAQKSVHKSMIEK